MLSKKSKFIMMTYSSIVLLLAFCVAITNDGQSTQSLLYDIFHMTAGFTMLIVFIFLYFFPTFTAKRREHQSLGPIFMLNLFFGWTLVGWIICLAWSLS